jgi:hypothetical protein
VKPEELYHMLHKRPFEPFRIHLTDGRVFDIRYPALNLVGVSYLIIGIPVPNDPDPVADQFIKVPLSLFDRVEPLSAAPATVPN